MGLGRRTSIKAQILCARELCSQLSEKGKDRWFLPGGADQGTRKMFVESPHGAWHAVSTQEKKMIILEIFLGHPQVGPSRSQQYVASLCVRGPWGFGEEQA